MAQYENAWVSKADLARHLGVGKRTIDGWMARGTIPYTKPGATKQTPVRFSIEAVEKALGRYTREAKAS